MKKKPDKTGDLVTRIIVHPKIKNSFFLVSRPDITIEPFFDREMPATFWHAVCPNGYTYERDSIYEVIDLVEKLPVPDSKTWSDGQVQNHNHRATIKMLSGHQR